jgi:hypothetical protein
LVGQSNAAILLGGGFIGDPHDALLTAFATYEQSLQTATGLQVDGSLIPTIPEYIDTTTADLFGGLLTSADADFVESLDPDLAARLRTGEEIILVGTVDTDIFRQDVTFQIVPEPGTFALLCTLLASCAAARCRYSLS